MAAKSQTQVEFEAVDRFMIDLRCYGNGLNYEWDCCYSEHDRYNYVVNTYGASHHIASALAKCNSDCPTMRFIYVFLKIKYEAEQQQKTDYEVLEEYAKATGS
jgi:hypothetical protein